MKHIPYSLQFPKIVLHFYHLVSIMGNKDSKPKDIKQLCKETKMNQKEITAFYKDFKKVTSFSR